MVVSAVRVACMCVVAVCGAVGGFAFQVPVRFIPTAPKLAVSRAQSPWTTRAACGAPLFASSEQAAQQDVEAEPPAPQEDEAAEGEEEEAEEAEVVEDEAEEGEDEDDPIKEIKAEIRELEKTLRAKRDSAAALRAKADDSGQAGFLRLRAQVNNYQALRGKDKKDLQKDATTSLVKSFIPVLKSFDEAEDALPLETEAEMKIHNSYAALGRQLGSKFIKLGAEPFYAVVGELYDPVKHLVADQEYSDRHPRGTIVDCEDKGLEFDGEMIMRARAIVSLGPEGGIDSVLGEVPPAATPADEGEGEGEDALTGG